MRTSLLLLASLLGLGAASGCGPRAASPCPVTAPAPAPAPPSTDSAWYLDMVERHGVAGVLVGTVQYVPMAGWVSARTDGPLEAPEYAAFIEGLFAELEALAARRLPDAPPLAAPTLAGDRDYIREIPLVFDPAYMSQHVDVLIETLDVIRGYLAAPGNGQYRIGVFEGGLLIYPDGIVLGAEHYEEGLQLADKLPGWLSTLTFEERIWD